MKTVPQISAAEAAQLVRSGQTLLAGGFGMTGHPVHLLHALAERPEVRELTFVGNNVGEANLGGGRLLRNGQIRKAIGSFFTSNRQAVQAHQAGSLEIELIPQGTFAEALRAGGAGIGGFFTPTGAGTVVAEGKETRMIGGREHVFEEPIRADYAFIKAWKGDERGNLIYRMSARNFNPVMAAAAGVTIAEVEEIAPVGEIAPENVHTPGIFVQRVVLGEDPEKPIEIRTNLPRSGRGEN